MNKTSVSAWSERLLEHSAFVRRIALHLVRDPHRADDVTQDVLLAALRSRTEPERGLRSWLAGVTRNVVSKLHRGRWGVTLRRADPAASPLTAEIRVLRGGEVTMPLAETFWSPAFGMLRDRFGVEWMVNVHAAES